MPTALELGHDVDTLEELLEKAESLLKKNDKVDADEVRATLDLLKEQFGVTEDPKKPVLRGPREILQRLRKPGRVYVNFESLQGDVWIEVIKANLMDVMRRADENRKFSQVRERAGNLYLRT